jgi:hypothetical protein
MKSDTMFDLPSLEGVEEVGISKQVVEGTAPPRTSMRIAQIKRRRERVRPGICISDGHPEAAVMENFSKQSVPRPPDARPHRGSILTSPLFMSCFCSAG